MKNFAEKIDSRAGTAVFLVVVFIYLYCTLFVLPATPIFFENDHFSQMHDSVRMLNGARMYADYFSVSFPGTQVWYVMLFSIFGQKLWLLNATILLLGFSLTATILALSRQLMSGVAIYVAPSLFLFFGFRWFATDGGHRLFSCLFAALAVLAIVKMPTRSRLILAGVFCALSAFFTQNRGLGVAAGIGLFLTWHAYNNQDFREWFISTVTFSGSFAVTLAILLSYFLVTVGPSTFFGSTILTAASYTSDPLNNSNVYFQFWQDLLRGRPQISSLPVDLFYYLLVPAAYILPLAYDIWRRKKDLDLWRPVILLSLVGLSLFAVTSGLSSVRLYHISIPGLVLFALWISRRRGWTNFAFAGVSVVACLAFMLCIYGQVKTYPPAVMLPTGTVYFTSEQAGERYRWLNENTEPGDVVFEPYRSVVNFPLKLQNPTAFFMLRATPFTPTEHVNRAVAELTASPPKYILWDGRWSVSPEARADGDNLAPLYEYLKQNYSLREKLLPVYEWEVEVWERSAAK